MNNRPLLFFPAPSSASPSKRGGGAGRIHHPSVSRQGIRVEPKLSRLQAIINSRRAEVISATPGIEPEYTIVIETYGSVDEFFKAARHISGLEWLGEYETTGIEPDEDFYHQDNTGKALTGRVLMMLSDRKAIDELLSLWRRYIQNPQIAFERGYAKFRDLFLHLKDIRYWGTQDRLFDTGIIDYWEHELSTEQDSPIRFEAELWFRGNEQKRVEAQSIITETINSLDGQLITSCCIPSIQYHSLLLELPIRHIERILADDNVSLVRCDQVMLFRPVGQMCVEPLWDESLPQDESVFTNNEIEPTNIRHLSTLQTIPPKVALLDGLPLANHNDLVGKLIIDDPDNYEENYSANSRIHGTAMASLIANGDLNEQSQVISSPIYVRPILKPNSQTRNGYETIPADVLPLDLIHRAVKRIFDGEGTDQGVAPSVRVINMSIGDPNIHFSGKMSAFARLLDWLSVKYNVLFIVSSGNHPHSIALSRSGVEFRGLPPEQQQAEIFQAIHSDTRNRKLLSPAESINSVTVGAIHADSSQYNLRTGQLNIYQDGMPATYSAHGNGYKRAVKPDIVFPGGRVIYNEPMGITPASLKGLWMAAPPGIMVPYPDASGDLSRRAFSRGTSNATALATKSCVEIYDSLEAIFSANDKEPDLHKFSPLLIKSLITHGASWGGMSNQLASTLTGIDSKKLKSTISQFIGYGKPDVERVKTCLDNRATILGYGSLAGGHAHSYRLPIPIGLGGVNVWRKLTITLSWFAEPCTSNLKYRDSVMWASLEGENKSLASERNYDWQQVRRGTLHHEIFEGETVTVLSQNRELEIKVNCQKDAAQRLNSPINYALAITLEVSPDVDINIYQDILTAINLQIQQQTQERIQAS
ncbi:S8 family peptidase [Yersinia enterocolitica]